MAYEDLYFVPILARAFETSVSQDEWKEAMAEIERLGRQPEYHQGYQQYQRFMELAVQHLTVEETNPEKQMQEWIRDLILELAVDSFTGDEEERQAALNLIASQPEWQQEYDRLYTDINEAIESPTGIEIQVEKDGKPFGIIQFQPRVPFGFIENVEAGFYGLKLETGRVLWEGELTAKDLIWTQAFPGRAFELAALTKSGEPTVTKEEALLGGNWVLQVIPGVENGRMEIKPRTKP